MVGPVLDGLPQIGERLELVDVSQIYASELSRIRGIVRAVVWLKKGLMSVLRAYGIAPGENRSDTLESVAAQRI